MGTKFGFVNTYPPTHCGIATFSASLISAIQEDPKNSVSVVRLVDSDESTSSELDSAEVVSIMRAGQPNSLRLAADLLNQLDVAIIQHEFGIYGGVDGEEAITLLQSLRIPTIVVLHTVLAEPTVNQRAVFMKICSLASAVVTMSRSSRDQLVANYLVDPRKIFPIPHGARPVANPEYKGIGDSPLVLTWGLIGPGKGIEWAIEAMHKLRDMKNTPRYVVAGRTHPKVLERNGEAYRRSLQDRVDKLGMKDSVVLQGDYMSAETLDDLISTASVILLPYDSTDQATSGVLIEAIAAWRPVVATGFPHANELLATGAGLVVAHRDPIAIAEGIRKILEEPELAQSMSNRARIMASDLLWPAVAARYVRLATRLIRSEVAA